MHFIPPSHRHPELGHFRQLAVENLTRTVLLLLLLVLAYVGVASWYAWADERAAAVRMLAAIADLEARAIDGYFSHLEVDLQDTAEALPTAADGGLDLERAFVQVKRLRALHPELFNVTLISPAGDILLTAKSAPGSTRATLADEASFQRYLDEVKQGKAVVIGQPLVAVINKVAIVPLRYAAKDGQGRLRFILSANLPHAYLSSFWLDAPITAKAAIGLVRDNGYLLSRFPVPALLTLNQIYGQPRTGALISHLQQHGFPEHGSVQGPSSLDGPDFLTTFRRLPHYPVSVFVTMPMTEVWSDWWARVSIGYLSLLLLLAGTAVAYRLALRRQRTWDAEQQRIEHELSQSEQRFRSLIERNHAVILQIDPESGQILDANAAASVFYGWSHQQLCAMTIAQINTLAPEQVAAERLAARAAQRNYFVFEHRLASGQIRTVEVHSTPVSITGTTILVSLIHDVTDRVDAEATIRSLLREQQAILDSDVAGIVKIRERRFAWMNSAFAQMLGYQPDELIGGSTRVVFPTDAAYADFAAVAYPVICAGNKFRTEGQYRCQDGTLRWCDLCGVLMAANEVESIWSVIDITERKHAERLLQESQLHLQTVIDNEPECIKTVDAQGRIRQMNAAGLAMVEADSPDQVLGKPMQDLIAPQHHAAFTALHQQVLAGQPGRLEFEVIGLKGGRRWLETHAAPMTEHGATVHLAVTRDITERKQMEEDLRQLAFQDALTGLPNRRLLTDRLGQAILANRRSGKVAAMMFMDLDNFKPLNDLHGHEIGDLLLIEVACRLKRCVREIDTVARLGGDEFIVMLSELTADPAESAAQATLIAEKIRLALAQPYRLVSAESVIEHHCSVSIGVALFANHQGSQDDILNWADAAMYQAKHAGRDTVRFYQPASSAPGADDASRP